MSKPEECINKISKVPSEAQASKLLEQALLEMDGILSGNNTLPTSVVAQSDSPERDDDPLLIAEVSRRLAVSLHNSSVIFPPEPDVRDTLFQWIQMSPGYSVCTVETHRNQNNAELQIQVLSEQIEAQTENILELEKVLQEKQQLLVQMENELQREILSRSALETQKLELLSIIQELRITNSALEVESSQSNTAQINNCVDCLNVVKSKLMSENQFPSEKYHFNGVFTEKASRHINVHHSSLPRQQHFTTGQLSMANVDTVAGASDTPKGSSFGKIPSYIGIRTRGQSVPNLENEKIYLEYNNKTESPDSSHKARGIWKILNLMKRSGSGNLNDISGTVTLTRGGIRATTGGRLGWSENHWSKELQKPLQEWVGEDFYIWLQDLGLDQYVQDAKKWLKSDQQVQQRNIFELEKILNIKNILHRKKLHLALTDLQDCTHTDLHLHEAGKLDSSWILRWLDDIGLPQHKEQFLINKVDGRVLHRLTLDDLSCLHITSMLHVTSIKRGIQVLRENNFNPNCLQRRSLPDDLDRTESENISLWTTHRVMEWLRSVDLAEYAPNLRGAGVHGGLIVYEVKFTSDLLAMLLSIPPGKTLLRRHLNTRFKELLGPNVIQKKREAVATIGFIPLTPSTKFKVPKKSQFSLKMKSDKRDRDYGDLVCPLDSTSILDEEEGATAGGGCIS